jgi:hypothetical protein
MLGGKNLVLVIKAGESRCVPVGYPIVERLRHRIDLNNGHGYSCVSRAVEVARVLI